MRKEIILGFRCVHSPETAVQHIRGITKNHLGKARHPACLLVVIWFSLDFMCFCISPVQLTPLDNAVYVRGSTPCTIVSAIHPRVAHFAFHAAGNFASNIIFSTVNQLYITALVTSTLKR